MLDLSLLQAAVALEYRRMSDDSLANAVATRVRVDEENRDPRLFGIALYPHSYRVKVEWEPGRQHMAALKVAQDMLADAMLRRDAEVTGRLMSCSPSTRVYFDNLGYYRDQAMQVKTLAEGEQWTCEKDFWRDVAPIATAFPAMLATEDEDSRGMLVACRAAADWVMRGAHCPKVTIVDPVIAPSGQVVSFMDNAVWLGRVGPRGHVIQVWHGEDDVLEDTVTVDWQEGPAGASWAYLSLTLPADAVIVPHANGSPCGLLVRNVLPPVAG